MNRRVNNLPRAVVLGLLLGVLLWSVPGEAKTVVVQTTGNQLDATQGESGATVGASAGYTVLVFDPSTGEPMPNLGANVGDGTSVIALPAGWFQGIALTQSLCNTEPTQFLNKGSGIYFIRVVPFTGNPLCVWQLGEHHYFVDIKVEVLGTIFHGIGLGVLEIK